MRVRVLAALVSTEQEGSAENVLCARGIRVLFVEGLHLHRQAEAVQNGVAFWVQDDVEMLFGELWSVAESVGEDFQLVDVPVGLPLADDLGPAVVAVCPDSVDAEACADGDENIEVLLGRKDAVACGVEHRAAQSACLCLSEVWKH